MWIGLLLLYTALCYSKTKIGLPTVKRIIITPYNFSLTNLSVLYLKIVIKLDELNIASLNITSMEYEIFYITNYLNAPLLQSVSKINVYLHKLPYGLRDQRYCFSARCSFMYNGSRHLTPSLGECLNCSDRLASEFKISFTSIRLTYVSMCTIKIIPIEEKSLTCTIHFHKLVIKDIYERRWEYIIHSVDYKFYLLKMCYLCFELMTCIDKEFCFRSIRNQCYDDTMKMTNHVQTIYGLSILIYDSFKIGCNLIDYNGVYFTYFGINPVKWRDLLDTVEVRKEYLMGKLENLRWPSGYVICGKIAHTLIGIEPCRYYILGQVNYKILIYYTIHSGDQLVKKTYDNSFEFAFGKPQYHLVTNTFRTIFHSVNVSCQSVFVNAKMKFSHNCHFYFDKFRYLNVTSELSFKQGLYQYFEVLKFTNYPTLFYRLIKTIAIIDVSNIEVYIVGTLLMPKCITNSLDKMFVFRWLCEINSVYYPLYSVKSTRNFQLNFTAEQKAIYNKIKLNDSQTCIFDKNMPQHMYKCYCIVRTNAFHHTYTYSKLYVYYAKDSGVDVLHLVASLEYRPFPYWIFIMIVWVMLYVALFTALRWWTQLARRKVRIQEGLMVFYKKHVEFDPKRSYRYWTLPFDDKTKFNIFLLCAELRFIRLKCNLHTRRQADPLIDISKIPQNVDDDFTPSFESWSLKINQFPDNFVHKTGKKGREREHKVFTTKNIVMKALKEDMVDLAEAKQHFDEEQFPGKETDSLNDIDVGSAFDELDRIDYDDQVTNSEMSKASRFYMDKSIRSESTFDGLSTSYSHLQPLKTEVSEDQKAIRREKIRQQSPFMKADEIKEMRAKQNIEITLEKKKKAAKKITDAHSEKHVSPFIKPGQLKEIKTKKKIEVKKPLKKNRDSHSEITSKRVLDSHSEKPHSSIIKPAKWGLDSHSEKPHSVFIRPEELKELMEKPVKMTSDRTSERHHSSIKKPVKMKPVKMITEPHSEPYHSVFIKPEELKELMEKSKKSTDPKMVPHTSLLKKTADVNAMKSVKNPKDFMYDMINDSHSKYSKENIEDVLKRMKNVYDF